MAGGKRILAGRRENVVQPRDRIMFNGRRVVLYVRDLRAEP